MPERMPALFVGHGSPMNAVENNKYTKKWQEIGRQMARPRAILMISAHWYTHGTRIMDTKTPRLVYDMYGFPEELYRVHYPSPGSPELAARAQELLSVPVQTDNNWGIDHGAWSVLCHLFPEANVPVVQLSVDGTAGAQAHFQMGQDLSALRDEGVMIIGSGNIVHNLARIQWEAESGFSWAEEFDGYIRDKIEKREFPDVVDYRKAGSCAKMAFPMPDHFYPLMYALGASNEEDRLTVFNEDCLMGSLSMTSYLFQP